MSKGFRVGPVSTFVRLCTNASSTLAQNRNHTCLHVVFERPGSGVILAETSIFWSFAASDAAAGSGTRERRRSLPFHVHILRRL